MIVRQDDGSVPGNAASVESAHDSNDVRKHGGVRGNVQRWRGDQQMHSAIVPV